jgi:hypothetical protein
VPRRLLSPTLESDYISVGVDRSKKSLRVKYDAFNVDSRLGRVTSSGSLSSKLYLCRLYTLISHCLLDPLTGRTGTEEALRIL